MTLPRCIPRWVCLANAREASSSKASLLWKGVLSYLKHSGELENPVGTWRISLVPEISTHSRNYQPRSPLCGVANCLLLATRSGAFIQFLVSSFRFWYLHPASALQNLETPFKFWRNLFKENLFQVVITEETEPISFRLLLQLLVRSTSHISIFDLRSVRNRPVHWRKTGYWCKRFDWCSWMMQPNGAYHRCIAMNGVYHRMQSDESCTKPKDAQRWIAYTAEWCTPIIHEWYPGECYSLSMLNGVEHHSKFKIPKLNQIDSFNSRFLENRRGDSTGHQTTGILHWHPFASFNLNCSCLGTQVAHKALPGYSLG